jgi:ribosomal protein L7/L12
MNTSYLLVGIAAIIVIAVLVWLGKRNAVKDTFTGNVDSNHHTEPPSATGNTNITPGAAEAEVRDLLEAGKKIEAIKRVREQTGLGLKEAKDLVEALERGVAVSIHTHQHPPAGDASDVDGAARKLVDSGQLIEAVKLVRDRKNLGLKEAKEYVDRL